MKLGLATSASCMQKQKRLKKLQHRTQGLWKGFGSYMVNNHKDNLFSPKQNVCVICFDDENTVLYLPFAP